MIYYSIALLLILELLFVLFSFFFFCYYRWVTHQLSRYKQPPAVSEFVNDALVKSMKAIWLFNTSSPTMMMITNVSI